METNPREDSWEGLWAWAQSLARRSIKAAVLALLFLAFVWLHFKLNLAAENELAKSPTALKVVQAAYIFGFVVAYGKLLYEMVDTFLPVGSTIRWLWGLRGKR